MKNISLLILFSIPLFSCAPSSQSQQSNIAAINEVLDGYHQAAANGEWDTYFDLIDERLPGHGESVPEMRKRHILIDGAPTEGQGLLLQIFTENLIGPIFFELIQRKGNEGFGEGNFQALFESLEQDQIRRGVLEDTDA